jgi:hypothetical protein
LNLTSDRDESVVRLNIPPGGLRIVEIIEAR